MVVMRLKDHKWCNAKHLHAQILWIEIQSVAVLIDHNPNPLPTPFSKFPHFSQNIRIIVYTERLFIHNIARDNNNIFLFKPAQVSNLYLANCKLLIIKCFQKHKLFMYNYLFDEVKYKEVSTSVWPHVCYKLYKSY